MIELLNGDCLELMKQMPDKSIDAIITDPPYGNTACKWDSVIPFDLMWAELNRIIKPNGAIVLFGSQPFTSALIMSNPKMFKYEWVWHKNEGSGFATAKYQPIKYHENILIFCNTKTNYFPLKTIRNSEASIKACSKPIRSGAGKSNHINNLKSGEYKKYDELYKTPESVLNFNSVPNGGGKKLHPTQKPVALLEYLAKTYTNENETILDFTMGSGTTGVACINTKRNFIGIEQDTHYFEVARKRIDEAQQAHSCGLF